MRVSADLSEQSYVRRARTVVCFWDGSQLVVSNFRTRMTVIATPVVVLVLSLLNEWSSPAKIVRMLAKFKRQDVLSTIRRLLRYGLLVEKDSPAAHEDELLQKSWVKWLPHAGFFHFGTKDVRYESGPKKLLKIHKQLLRASPQPPLFKSYPGKCSIPLPRPKSKSTFTEILMGRRTEREFSSSELPLELLSRLLFYTWSVTDFLEVPLLGQLPLKTSPSAGARHPIEAYVLSMRVQGLKPGLYHYQVETHCLEQLGILRNAPARAIQFCARQPWAGEAAALFIMTAVFERSMWKYPTSRAYRTVLLDAGHLCQTFYLVTTWLNLACFCTIAFSDSLVEKELGIDGISESVIYVTGVGTPLRETDVRRRNLSLASM